MTPIIDAPFRFTGVGVGVAVGVTVGVAVGVGVGVANSAVLTNTVSLVEAIARDCAVSFEALTFVNVNGVSTVGPFAAAVKVMRTKT